MPRPSHFYNQSGVIAYRRAGAENELEILLITSSGRGRWIIPKGVIDPGESAIDSAVREAYEEAGVQGKPGPAALGQYQYAKWGGVCTVEVFALEVETVHETWPEEDIRRRQWMTIAQAARSVEEAPLKELILSLRGV